VERRHSRYDPQASIWEGVLGFELHATEEPALDPGELRLRLDIHRSGAFALFALAVYGAMVVLGCSALAVGILTFVNGGILGLRGTQRDATGLAESDTPSAL
jgi:hypothetical protein